LTASKLHEECGRPSALNSALSSGGESRRAGRFITSPQAKPKA
jgi:hypothetical protein